MSELALKELERKRGGKDRGIVIAYVNKHQDSRLNAKTSRNHGTLNKVVLLSDVDGISYQPRYAGSVRDPQAGSPSSDVSVQAQWRYKWETSGNAVDRGHLKVEDFCQDPSLQD